MEIFELLISSGLFILIWIIQYLHYPSFLFVDQKVFPEFEAFHTRRISVIVIPLMISELILLIFNPRPILVVTVSLIWLSTFLLQVPCHNRLKHGYDERIIKKLIQTNWIRTMLWTLKFLYLLGVQKW